MKPTAVQRMIRVTAEQTVKQYLLCRGGARAILTDRETKIIAGISKSRFPWTADACVTKPQNATCQTENLPTTKFLSNDRRDIDVGRNPPLPGRDSAGSSEPSVCSACLRAPGAPLAGGGSLSGPAG